MEPQGLTEALLPTDGLTRPLIFDIMKVLQGESERTFFKGNRSCACFLLRAFRARPREVNWLKKRIVLLDGLTRAGVTVLRSEAVDLQEGGESIRLIGLDDLGVYYQALAGDSSHSQALSEAKDALKGDLSALVRDAGFTLALSHRPELIDLYAECGADLVLCGHAHGGQVRLPFIGGLYAPGQGFFPAWDAGLYEAGGTQMIVSRGLGNSAFPLRVNNRPEVVTITLRRAD